MWTMRTLGALLVLFGVHMEMNAADEPDLDELVGQSADIAPSAYQYRSDRAAEENPPETAFLFGAVGHPKVGVLCGLLWEEPRARLRELVEALEVKPPDVVPARRDWRSTPCPRSTASGCGPQTCWSV